MEHHEIGAEFEKALLQLLKTKLQSKHPTAAIAA
jgi:hypothetical protein